MHASLLAPVLLLLSAAGADAPPAGPAAEAPPTAPAISPPTSPPTSPSTSPPPVVTAPSASTVSVAAAADAPAVARETQPTTQSTQDLEDKVIQLRRELDALEKQRAAWDDMRRNLDELVPRVDELARRSEQLLPARAPSTPHRSTDADMLFRTADGSTWFRPQVRLQAGYFGTLVEREGVQKARPETSTFLVQHAELQFEGNVLQRRFEYRLLFDFVDPAILKDAFVQWRQSNWLAVRVGQYKLPFGFQRYLRSTYYDFVDLSETMTAFSLERDVGLMVVGRPLGGKLQYQLAFTNGAGAGKVNDNRDFAYTARVVAAPWGPLPESEGDLVGQPRPLLSVGAAGYFNLVPTDIVARTNNSQASTLDSNGRIDNVAVWQGGVELRTHFRGAALQGELFRRIEHPGAGANDRNFAGEYLQASYFVIPHFVAVDARVERTDLPLYGATLAQRQASGTHTDGQTAGVSAFLRGHDLKMQVDYTHLRTAGVVLAGSVYSPDSHRLRVSAQLMF